MGGYKCFQAGPGKFGVRAGADGAALGGLSYSMTVPFFGTGPSRRFRRPLLLAFDSSSEYERGRNFSDLKTNERRAGASLRAVLPLQSSADTDQFELLLEARRQTVSLIRNNITFDKQNLTTIDMGVRFFVDGRRKMRPSTLEFVSRLKVGWEGSAPSSGFSVFNASLAFHRELSDLFAVDLKAQMGLAGIRTPIFEQPSFGSVDTVRGFRADDAIGLRSWSTQPEIWLRGQGLIKTAIDPATDEQNKLRQFLRESLALAVFYDVGGIYRTTNSISGARSGPGVGIRFTYKKQATLRFDWAHGVGDGVSGKGRGRFYFSFDIPENPF
jgi:hemolysin activation/secretion protein